MMIKIIFIMFTVLMANYVSNFTKYDVGKSRGIAYIYMVIAAVLAVQV